SLSNDISMPSSGDSLQRLRALPRAPAPNDDAATVKSNLPHQDVELLQNILAYHVAHRPGSSVFGNSHANRLRLTEAYVRPRQEVRDAPQRDSSRQPPGTQKARPRADELEAVTVCEIVVEEGRGLFSPLFALGIAADIDATGLSTSMNIIWHAAAVRCVPPLTASTDTHARTCAPLGLAKCGPAGKQVFDGGDGRLLISASQIVSPIQGRATGAAARASRTSVAVPEGRAKL
ncbi:hypothetical protein TRAPUB_9219, partial [Trametes pubescens]